MSELEDMIGKILSDPGEMEKITQMASQLMGGGQKEEKSGPQMPDLGFDPAMFAGIGKLFSKANSGENDKTALLAAMAPYLKKERRDKLEKAMRISRLAKIAGMAMEEYGDGRI